MYCTCSTYPSEILELVSQIVYNFVTCIVKENRQCLLCSLNAQGLLNLLWNI